MRRVPSEVNVYFWNTFIAKIYKNESQATIGDERIEIAGDYEITIPASVLNWTLESQAFQEGMFIEYRLQVKRTSDEIDILTSDKVTLTGYAPTNYFTQTSGSVKPRIEFQHSPTAASAGILVWYTSKASYTEAQSAGSLTLTINNPKYDQTPLKINWGLAAGELMTAT